MMKTERQIKNAASCQKLARILYRQGNFADAARVYKMARDWMAI